jgi:hypothetical protein
VGKSLFPYLARPKIEFGMHIEFLVEEPSAEAALKNLIPKLMGEDISFNIHVFQGKQDLLKNLPNRLRGYRHWLPHDWYIVVLIDKDQEDCVKLKQNLEQTAHDEGFITRSNSNRNMKFNVINRIAIEELESWFFGDVAALEITYPRIPRFLNERRNFRDPDTIRNTSETLERILKGAGYYRGGLPKIEVARRVSLNMEPSRNISKSFQVFWGALQNLIT